MTNYKNISITKPDNTLLCKETAEAILVATDWTQLPDNSLTSDCVEAFATYRESISTIRKTSPSNPTWPTAPVEEWK